MMRNGYKSAVSIAFAVGVTTGLKYVVNRTRPFTEYPNDIIKRDHAGPYSFPSGHTTAAFATATAVSLSYKKWYVTVPAYAYASLVGYSRMRLGMHYGTDVLGGMLIGIGSGLLTWQLDKAFNKK
jgi:undecaprenyl-diphosphatase